MTHGKFHILTTREYEGYIDEENQIAYCQNPFGRWIATDIQSGLDLTRDLEGYETREECADQVMRLMEVIKEKRNTRIYQACVRVLQVFRGHSEQMTNNEI